MTPQRLRNLVSLLREQKITYYKGTWANEEIEIRLGDNKQQEEVTEDDTPAIEHREISKEDLIRQFDADLF